MFCLNRGTQNPDQAKFCENRLKKTIVISIMFAGAFFLSGCGQKQTVQPQEDSTLTSNDNNDDLESSAPISETQTYFYDGRDFSDGVAWVKRTSTSNWEAIDNKGKFLFSLESGEEPKTDFSDGAAMVRISGSDNNESEKLVEKSGTVIFPKDDDRNSYKLLAYYGKYYFVRRHINTFEKTADETGVINNAGQLMFSPTDDLSIDWQSTGSTGKKGIFDMVDYHGNNFYDAYTNEFFKSGDDDKYKVASERLISQLYQGNLIYLHSNGNSSSPLWYLWPSQTHNSMSYNYSYTDQFQNASELGFHETKTGFYDKDKNLVIDLSSYKDAFAIGDFSDGYCTLRVDNPQDNSFWTVIDSKGTQMFEPIAQESSKVSCGRVLVKQGENNDDKSEYYIKVNGGTVIPNITDGSDFAEGDCLAKVGQKDSENSKEVNYIDTNGNIAF